MANNTLVSTVIKIGGALDATWAAATKTVEDRIKALDEQASKARGLATAIGETQRLRRELNQARKQGALSVGDLQAKLDSSLDGLRKQGIQVRKLNQEYQALGRAARSLELRATGQRQIEQGKTDLKSSYELAKKAVGVLAVPVKINADYQATIRDIAIKGNIANTPQEAQLARNVLQVSRDSGLGRGEVASLIAGMTANGTSLDKAQQYAGLAAKFVVGQGADVGDTATLIRALETQAGITDPKTLERALEAMALQGQAGNFEAADMARLLPDLLKGAKDMKLTGMDAVSQVGSMLQLQMSTANGADEAAGNLKNWMGEIRSPATAAAYAKAGIDYEGSLQTGLEKGMSTLEASFALAMKYIQVTDPAKAAQMTAAQAQISQQTDPQKAQAMLAALAQSLRGDNLFANMQVNAALQAYAQGQDGYQKLKQDSLTASGVLDKNQAERRGTSAQIWKEADGAVDNLQQAFGQALTPATDRLGQSLTWLANGMTELTHQAAPAVLGVTVLAGSLLALKKLQAAYTLGKGLFNVARGSMMGNPDFIQKVLVTNPGALGGGDYDIDTSRDKKGGKGRRGGRGAKPKGGLATKAVQKLKDLLGSGNAGRAGKASKGALVLEAGISAVKNSGNVIKPLIKGGSVLSVAGAVYQAADTYQNAKTRDEKAEGYGKAAGGLAGGVLGAAAGAVAGVAASAMTGAMVGSAVPVLGTVVGGIVGAGVGILSAWAGTEAGGYLGKKLFGGDDSLKSMPAAGPLMMRDAGKNIPPVMDDIANSFKSGQTPPLMGQVVRSMPSAPGTSSTLAEPFKAPLAPAIEQQFSFAPAISVTVQGDVKDPAQLARELEPYLRWQFDEYSRQASARQLSDAPHV
ncbi:MULTISPECIES: phage tail tape measure protein [unclassified Pseudomonas]|uniref:phage tail tape measure protein n=1 Tax=unclassified Pseudomonas TaxID=196821 RepID=UPI0008381456|nr:MULTISPECIES: phage tail tape measure protein [unclassified Pseudomonas]QIH06539.1 phage tail protein [Pseudomonas sp. BIOMIG1BAC]